MSSALTQRVQWGARATEPHGGWVELRDERMEHSSESNADLARMLCAPCDQSRAVRPPPSAAMRVR